MANAPTVAGMGMSLLRLLAFLVGWPLGFRADLYGSDYANQPSKQ